MKTVKPIGSIMEYPVQLADDVSIVRQVESYYKQLINTTLQDSLDKYNQGDIQLMNMPDDYHKQRLLHLREQMSK